MNFLDVLGVSAVIISYLALGLSLARIIVARKWLPQQFLLVGTYGIICLIGYVSFYVHILNQSAGLWFTRGLICYGLLLFVLHIKNIKVIIAERTVWLYPLILVSLIGGLFCLFASNCTYQSSVWGERPTIKPCTFKVLPEDNLLPHMFALRIAENRSFEPVAGWLLADRPPIQSGVLLTELDGNIGNSENAAESQLIGMFLQLSWVAALYGAGLYLGIKKRAFLIAILAIVFSGFGYINTIYVWPKMLAGSFVLVALVLLFCKDTADKYQTEYLQKKYIPVSFFFISLGMLSHTGVLFTVIPLGIMFIWGLCKLVKEKRAPYKAVLVGLIIGVVLMAPWIVFKEATTLSDHLVKLQLAGATGQNDDRSTGQAIIQAYKNLTITEWVRNKWTNIIVLFYNPEVRHFKNLEITAQIRQADFYSVFYALGFMNIGIIWLLIKRRLKFLKSEKIFIKFILATIVVWVLVLFTPGSTIIHQGSYTIMLMLFMLSGIGVSLMKRKYQVFTITLQIIWMLTIWVIPFTFK